MEMMDDLAMAAAIVTVEFDTWGAWRTSINGIEVFWHAGYGVNAKLFNSNRKLLDKIASRLDEEIV